MIEIERGTLEQPQQLLDICSKYAPDSRDFKFCPGLDPLDYEKKRETIRYDLKSVKKMSVPFLRVESIKCLHWFKLGKTKKEEEKVLSCVHLVAV